MYLTYISNLYVKEVDVTFYYTRKRTRMSVYLDNDIINLSVYTPQ